MPATVVDRILRRRKARVGEGSDSYANRRLFVTLFGVKHGCSADRTEPESEFGSLVTYANVLGGSANDLVGSGEAGERCKDAAGSTLTREAVTDSDAPWLTLDFDAQLAAGTRGCSSTH